MSTQIIVRGEVVNLITSTHDLAVSQMIEAIGPVDRAGAAAWYVRFYEHYTATGIGYAGFMTIAAIQMRWK